MAWHGNWRVASLFLTGAVILLRTAPASTAASAAAGDAVSVWTGAEMKTVAAKLHSGAMANKIAGDTLATYPNGSCSLWMRSASGQAELHKAKTDLIVIQQGEATLVTGGVIPDARISAPNEVRGSSIKGGVSRHVAPGDVIRIAAGTPHQFQLEAGKTIAYLALKIPDKAAVTPAAK